MEVRIFFVRTYVDVRWSTYILLYVVYTYVRILLFQCLCGICFFVCTCCFVRIRIVLVHLLTMVHSSGRFGWIHAICMIRRCFRYGDGREISALVTSMYVATYMSAFLRYVCTQILRRFHIEFYYVAVQSQGGMYVLQRQRQR